MSGLYRNPADACSVRIFGTVSFCWAIPMVSFRADLCDHCSIHGTQNGLWENSIIQIIPGSFEPGIDVMIERCLCRIFNLCMHWRKLGLTAYISVVLQSKKSLQL